MSPINFTAKRLGLSDEQADKLDKHIAEIRASASRSSTGGNLACRIDNAIAFAQLAARNEREQELPPTPAKVLEFKLRRPAS